MVKKVIIILLIIISIIQCCFGQHAWTLEECIKYALDNNLDIQSQQLVTDQLELDYNQSKKSRYPDLIAGLDLTPVLGQSLNPATNNWDNLKNIYGSIGLSSSITVFDGLKNQNTILKKSNELLSNREIVEKIRNDITLTVAYGYLNVLCNRELLEVAKKQLNNTDLQVEKIKKMIDVGSGSNADLLNIIAQRSTDNLKVTNAENQFNLSLYSLAQYLNIDSAENFNIFVPQEPDIEKPYISLDSVNSINIDKLPQIISAQYNIKSAENSLAIAYSELYPDLTFRLAYDSRFATNPLSPNPIFTQTLYDPYYNQITNYQFFSASLSLMIPIFNKGISRTDINHAKIAVNESIIKLSQTKQVLSKEIQMAYFEAKAAYSKYKSTSEAMKANDEAFKFIEMRYNIGAASLIELNDAKNNFFRASSELLQSKYEYILKVKVLEFYQGIPVTLK